LQSQREGTLPDLLDSVLMATGYAEYLKASPEDADERFENVLELRSLMAEYEDVAGEEGGDLGAFLQDVALVADVDELREGTPAVTLITLHAAKGLEFPVVFLVGLEEGVLPHIRSFDDPRQMEEERRLCYVGITRAMDRLYLTRSFRRYSFGASAANPPSRFLADIPSHVKRPWGSTGRTYAEAAAAPSLFQGEENPDDAQWSAGDRVKHQKFGVGTIVSSQTNGGDVEYTVDFETAGVRRLLQSYAKLVSA
ncbi:MAG: ATP-binding domain-containing protein, partial [Phycisphaerae bacterium]|nr:ATP-binding domain-containing protein [Phycisphaerae bacterium]